MVDESERFFHLHLATLHVPIGTRVLVVDGNNPPLLTFTNTAPWMLRSGLAMVHVHGWSGACPLDCVWLLPEEYAAERARHQLLELECTNLRMRNENLQRMEAAAQAQPTPASTNERERKLGA